MKLSSLLKKRLVFVSGKGGVGKTTVSVLLALLAAKKNKTVLIVEMNSTGRIARLFDAEEPSHKEIPVAPYISTINLSPEPCFREYVLKHIRFSSLYKTFFENKYVSNFLNAVPGLNEVLMLGKIFELERQSKSRFSDEPAYDLIIVDAPATGHGLSALEVPRVLKSAVKIGPLHSHASQILDLFANHDKTAFCLVTLAEEMPVCESEEYIAALKEKTDLAFGPLFVNAVMPPIREIKNSKALQETSTAMWNYYRLAKERAELNKHYVNEIEKKFPDFEKVILPYQFEPLETARTLSQMLAPLMEAL